MGLGHYMGGDEWVSWGHSEYTHIEFHTRIGMYYLRPKSPHDFKVDLKRNSPHICHWIKLVAKDFLKSCLKLFQFFPLSLHMTWSMCPDNRHSQQWRVKQRGDPRARIEEMLSIFMDGPLTLYVKCPFHIYIFFVHYKSMSWNETIEKYRIIFSFVLSQPVIVRLFRD